MCFHIYQKINIKVIVEIVSEEPTKILFKITIPMKFCRSCNIGLIKVFVSKLHDLKTEKQKYILWSGSISSSHISVNSTIYTHFFHSNRLFPFWGALKYKERFMKRLLGSNKASFSYYSS